MNSPRSATDAATAGRANQIVVGIDGSVSAGRAATWAAQEAVIRGAELLVIHAYDVQVPMVAGMLVVPPAGFQDYQESAQAVLAQTADTLKAAFPHLQISSRLVNGSPLGALLSAGEHALITVVGSDGLGAFAKRILGSIPIRLAGHAESPVVVVRSESDTQPIDRDGTVLVGLDSSADSEDALVFAFEEASLREVDLIAVRVWDNTDSLGFGRAYPLPVNLDEIEAEERRELAEQLVGWTEKYPDVKVLQRLVSGRPAESLLRECTEHITFEAPSLMVVGCRGHGGFAGLMLGSISQAMISHAPCPVAVITRATSP